MSVNPRSELVVILHGIGMSTMRMAYLNYRLQRAGYKTLNLGYPSRSKTIEASADFAIARISQKLEPGIERIHFVGHSMGCLVALHILAQNAFTQAARGVFIAPPFRGSEVADYLQANRLYKYTFGPAGAQLTTAYRKGVTYDLPGHVEIGVIAGTRGYEYPFFLHVMKKTGVHDGLVALESTRLAGMKDHITLRFSHSFLLDCSPRHVIDFLKQGRFNHKDQPPPSP